jgi:DNA-binding MarR family transcriptional regulator
MSIGSGKDFGILLNLAFQSFKNGLHQHLAKQGHDDLGSSYGYVLRLLEDEPLCLREVAEKLEMTAQGASKIINEMVSKGYVTRKPDAGDGRIARLVVTQRGARVVAIARDYHLQFEADLVRRLGKRRASAARATLEEIVDSGESNWATARPV